MKFTEFSRNLIQCSSLISSLYDFCCSFNLYKKFVNNKIKQRIEYLKTHKEIKFMLEITSVCNAKCSFCPYSTMKREKKRMSDDIFFKITERIKQENIVPVSFDLWNIGEPFLDNTIFERIKILKENFPKVPIHITSNFEIVDNNTIEQLLDCDIDFINISLNATNKEAYYDIMKLDYDKTIKNIDSLIKYKKQKNKNLRISLSMILYNTKILEVLKFLFKYFFKVDTIKFQKATNWMKEVNIDSAIYKAKRKMYPCNEIWERLPILSNGEYALCCQDAEGLSKINVLDVPILEAYNSEFYRKTREIHLSGNLKNFEICNNCFGINSNGANWIFIRRY